MTDETRNRPSPYRQMLGTFVRSRRKDLGWTQETLAEKLVEQGFDYGTTTISAWESGKFGAPLLNENAEGKLLLDVLAELFNVDRFDLLANAVGGLIGPAPVSYEEQRWTALFYKLTPDEQTAVRLMLEKFTDRPKPRIKGIPVDELLKQRGPNKTPKSE